MREIKFRIWTTHYEEPTMIYLNGYKQRYDYENGFVFAFSEHDCFWGNENYESDHAKFEVMQFTGLKDKNRVDIYEGDIIKSWYSRDTTGEDIVEFIGVVEFESEPHREKAGYEIPFLRNAEVIGNIYENPELLNSEQEAQGSVASEADSKETDH